MKCVVLLLLLLSVAFAHRKSKSDSDVEQENPQDGCSYSVNGYMYDFSRAKGQVYSYTTQGENGKNITWSWSLCGPMNDSACGPNSALCIVDESTPSTTLTSYGNSSIAIAGDDDSITLSLSGDQECTPGQKKSATIKLNCTKRKKKQGRVQSAERDECTASLTIASRLGCADDDDDGHGPVALLIVLPLVLCCCACVVGCCVCCRRRMLRKRAAFAKLQEECNSVQMKQQPIPQPIPHPMPLQQPIRLMVPMNPQQQQFPYYPMYPIVQMPGQFPPTAPVPTPSAVVPPAPVAQEVQIDADEKMAKDLQAQFDKEVQV